MDDFLAELRRELQLPSSPVIDHAGEFLPSAVVVPLTLIQGEWHVLLEVRAHTLNRQPGEICFPGGRIEPDETPQAAALRETTEELGISIDELEVLGALPIVASSIGVMVFPYVAVVADSALVTPNTDEVAEWFTVPLAYLAAAEPIVGHMELASRPSADINPDLLPSAYSAEWRARGRYPVWFYPYQRWVIWGLTGRIVYSFINVCKRIRLS